jgi:hypothetical protein
MSNGGSGSKIITEAQHSLRHRADRILPADLDLDTYTLTAEEVVVTGTEERITGATGGEYIDFNDEGNGIIVLGGSGGTNDTDIAFDLDGTEPRLYSPTDTKITVDETLSVTKDIILKSGQKLIFDGA